MGGNEGPTPEQLEESKLDVGRQIDEGTFRSVLDDKRVWVIYLHTFAIAGKDKINEATTAHTYVRRPNENQEEDMEEQGEDGQDDEDDEGEMSISTRSFRGSGHLNKSMRDKPLESESIQGEGLKDKGHDDGESVVGDDKEGEEYEEDEDEEEFKENEDNNEVSEEEEDDDETLSCEDLNLVKVLPPPPPGSTPLALATIKQRLDNVLRQLEIKMVRVKRQLRTSVMHIITHLARCLYYYPIETLEKPWICDAAVAALRAAVWNVLGHERSGARSVQSLLSLQTTIMLLDQCGERVTSWLDMDGRKPTRQGRYLRWSMVAIRFCGYTESRGPNFVVNVDSNSSRLGDSHFYANTFATHENQPKSEDMAFCFVAMAITQRTMSPDLVRIFANEEFGWKLLRQSRKGFYEFRVVPKHVNAPVFIHGLVDPLNSTMNTGTGYRREALRKLPPLDKPAWGQCPMAMTTRHLNRALKVMSRHLDLDLAVTSHVFRTSYTFKVIIDGRISGWKALNMPYFSGPRKYWTEDNFPTFGPVDTRRTVAGTSSEDVGRIISGNGAIGLLPNRNRMDSGLMKQAKQQLSHFYEAVQDYFQDSNEVAPTFHSQRIIGTFAKLNNGAKKPFEEALEGLLALTSSEPDSWPKFVEKPHPFDDPEIRNCKGDLGIIQWLLQGSTRAMTAEEQQRAQEARGECQREYRREHERQKSQRKGELTQARRRMKRRRRQEMSSLGPRLLPQLERAPAKEKNVMN